MRYGLVNGFIDHLYTALRTTSNYSIIANLHILQITTAPAKPFPVCFVISHSLATASNSGDSSASCAQVLSSQPSMQNSTLNQQLTTAMLEASSHQSPNLLFSGRLSTNWVTPTVFLINTLHGPSRKHRFQQ
jgi:hypothetical protein